jgi:5'-methylthioadenosine phosphorylase
MDNETIVVGVIGGSGLYEISGFNVTEEINVETPFGNPSDKFITGNLNNTKVVFLPRHSRCHKLTPSAINYRANIYGLKKIGVNHIFSISAVGSMK